MRPSRFSPALAARRLTEASRPVLRLELPEYDHRFEEPPPRWQDDEPDALVLEADGSFTEIRD